MPYHLATPQYCRFSGKRNKGLGLAPNPLFCLGWVMGLEPTTPGTTIRYSNQLSYTHQIHGIMQRDKMARQKGFEPLAYCLEGSCSILLSYWRIFGAGDGNRTRIPSLEGWCPGHCATPACPPKIVSSHIISYDFFPVKEKIRKVAKKSADFFAKIAVAQR